ncbi:interferon-induced GTP-binding protein Mx isoform X2 [Protobothrops mucrosquamatus]|uniref:interferon-induced GTP-binding protein Mx isoform X2 n=1 Tax=Protobothrops mucrosquamatus TaxID=103944 RepID=UPI000775AC03|nr:interferon-induced GTP-binding protein Mx isoform X2 [Protobothrops mucrosquamatus]
MKSAKKKSDITEHSPNKRMKKEAENNLCSQYEEKVRPCIDLIDSLRALGVEKDLALPAIAVIGDQSSGKSSVLEALSGVALPRGSGIVTRCPLELKMKKKNNTKEWKGKMMYLETEVELKDPSEVEVAVRRAQNAIAGEGLSISNKLITLEISSPDVPDLTLIDLPGITRVAVGNQPQDIGHQIMKLIQSYITKQETINLVVVPSNVDIATTEALKMAQTVDPEGERTLGILTKPDLIDEGTEDETIDIVRNQRVPLKKGYMIVKCRGQSDLTNKLSLGDAIKKEREFFEEHKFFSLLLEEGRATIPLLAEKLTQELTEHIQKSLPTLEEQIENSLEVIHKKLQKYGEGVPESLEDKKYFFVQKINDFNKDLLKIVHGEEDIKYSKSKRTITDIRQAFNQWQDTINDNAIEISQSEEKTGTFPTVHKIKVNNFTYGGTGNFHHISRGRELPGFVNFKVFEDAIKWQIKQLEEPAIVVLKEVAELVRNTFLRLAVQHFSSYCALSNVARSVKVRLGTQIPMIIQLYVFRDFAERLQNEMMQVLQSGDQLEILFHEGKDVVNIRNSLNERIGRLHKARRLLKQFFI